MIKRGDIYWVDLSDAQGYETKNTHPCVVVSNDIQNRIGKRIIVAPLTSKIKKHYPFEVIITKLKSKIMLDQVRVITVKRLGKKRISWLTNEEMKKIDLALHLTLGINFCP
jgi:mRNA interferase MazF